MIGDKIAGFRNRRVENSDLLAKRPVSIAAPGKSAVMARPSSAVAASGAKYGAGRRDALVFSPNSGSATMTAGPPAPRGTCMRSRSRPLVR